MAPETQPQPGYKQTQLGEIPADWEVAYLGDIMTLEYGAGLPERARRPGSIPVYGSSGPVGVHWEALVKGPGIVVGRKGTIGAVTWCDTDFWPIDTTYYVDLGERDHDLRWLYYLLVFSRLERLDAATGVPGLNRNDAHREKVPVPSKREQKKIAAILTSVDKAIDKTQEIINQTERLKKGLMQQLLTRGIDHTQFQQTEVGEIPVEWDVVTVGDLGRVVTGNTPSTKNPAYWGNEFLFVSPLDMGEHKYVTSTEKMLTSEGLAVGRPIPKDAVMVTCIASIGKIGMAPEELCTNQQSNSIVCKEGVNAHFIYYLMQTKVRDLLRLAGQTAVLIVKKSTFEKMHVPLPPAREQYTIAAILSSVDERIEKERVYKARLERLKKGLMQVLLRGKIRVRAD